MLKLGEKGAILQRDKETYAIAPHIPCGVVTPALLRTIADVAEKYDAQAIKFTAWQLVIGGNVGAEPRIALELVKGLDDKQVLDAIEKTIQCYSDNAKKGKRLGKTIDRVGLKPFQAALKQPVYPTTQ